LWRRLDDALIRFADSGLKAIDALRVHASSLPQRWSTEGGPFLAKAASRILLANEFARFDPKLVGSARATLAEVRAAAPSAPLAMLHPTLYALEGVMTDAEAPLEPVAERLARILALASSTGELPEAPGSAVARSDVIAQALRVAILLRANAVAGSPADAALDRLAGALSRRVRPDGAIAFRPDAAPPELNSWCAMFAEQALRWYVHWRQTGAFAGVLAIDVV
jgi:hypothetical protein